MPRDTRRGATGGARITYIHHTQLIPHPTNMRRRYPLDDVRRMALSQAERARNGLDPCVQPLVVMPKLEGNRLKYVIVAGHLRHAGNAYLKDKAPLLNCIVRRYTDDAQVLAEMSTENGLRADISPLGWAEHFRRQIALGRSLRQVCRESGRSLHVVQSHLALLDLGPAAQALIDSGELPLGAGRLLLQVADPTEQSQAARQFAKSRATLVQIEVSLKSLASRKGRAVGRSKTALPGLRGTSRPSTDKLPAHHPAKFKDLREAARATCHACDISRPLPLAEPAWHLAVAAAGETCDCCGLQNAKDACSSCPLVDMLQRVAEVCSTENGASRQ